MSLWSTNPASVAATKAYANQVTDLDGTKPVIIYPNSSGVTTSGAGANYNNPISLNLKTSDSSAKAIESLSGSLGNAVTGLGSGLSGLGDSIGNGFQSLMDVITKQSANNNAWSAKQAQNQMDFQSQMQAQAMEYNSLEAAKNRNWQEMMSNTAHQREVADLKAAGLNPVLSASGGNGAAVTSGATAAGAGAPSGAKGDTDESGNSALAALFGAILSAQTSMYNANLSARTNLEMAKMQQETQMYGSELAAEASKYSAGTAYAASTYASDMNFKNSEAQRTWNAEHPTNAWQAAGSNQVKSVVQKDQNQNRKNYGQHHILSAQQI